VTRKIFFFFKIKSLHKVQVYNILITEKDLSFDNVLNYDVSKSSYSNCLLQQFKLTIYYRVIFMAAK